MAAAERVARHPPADRRHARICSRAAKRCAHSPIAGAVLTNGDVDHVAGLLSLREGRRFTLYATARVLRVLPPTGSSMCSIRAGDAPPAAARRGGSSRSAIGEPTASPSRPFPCRARWRSIWKTRGRDLGGTAEDTIGLEVADRESGAAFFYIPGCAAMTPELAQRLRGAALVLFDGTL